MKFFHALDTKIFRNKYLEYCAQYGVENIYAFRKSRIYLYTKVFPGLFLMIVLLVLGSIFIIQSGFTLQRTILAFIGLLFLCGIISLVFNIRIIDRYLNYICDFTLVTPLEIIDFNQQGILKRSIKSIGKEKVNSISTERDGLLLNLFNTGTLVVLLLGGNETGEVIIDYVYQPDEKRERIMAIINTDTPDEEERKEEIL